MLATLTIVSSVSKLPLVTSIVLTVSPILKVIREVSPLLFLIVPLIKYFLPTETEIEPLVIYKFPLALLAVIVATLSATV